jgi:hypothetical protein
MTRKIILLLWFTFIFHCSFSQKTPSSRNEIIPKIEITDFKIGANQYSFNCEIKDVTKRNYSLDQYLIFFIKIGNAPLHPLKVISNNDQQDFYLIQDDLDFMVKLLALKSFPKSNFYLYPVLLEGEVYALSKTLILIEGDMYRIEDALEVLYKANQKPLAFTEVKR